MPEVGVLLLVVCFFFWLVGCFGFFLTSEGEGRADAFSVAAGELLCIP